MSTTTGFPFAAVVGLEDVKLALLLGALDRRLGGVLLRGQKGSAKTTLARGLAELLAGEPPPPFVELPIGASEDRVVGTLDLGAALRAGERKFHPGLLADVDGGILYVDEVNLLPDHLVDVLLDVAVSGVNRVEREGMSHEHPSRFFLVGSMNPEEGELRPQLLDRFGLSVDVVSPLDPDQRGEAVRRRLAFDEDRAGFAETWVGATAQLRQRLTAAAARGATLPGDVVAVATRLAVEVGADGLRADLALCRAAAALCAWEARDTVDGGDIRRVAGLALAHRRRRGPFDEPTMSEEELEEAFARAVVGARAAGEGGRDNEGVAGQTEVEGHCGGERSDGCGPELSGAAGAAGGAEPLGATGLTAAPTLAGTSRDASGSSAQFGASESRALSARSQPGTDEWQATGELAIPLPSPPRGRRPNPTKASNSRRGPTDGGRHPSQQPGSSSAGRRIGARPAGPPGTPIGRIAVVPTALAASARRQDLTATGGGTGAAGPLAERCDLHEVVAEERRSHLIVLCVDTSGSMGAERRLAAARGAVLSFLSDAYRRRDRVAVVTFGGDGANVALRPTGSVEVARSRLAAVPTGGRTPLGEGLLRALDLCVSPATRSYDPVLVLVSDGRATAGPGGGDALAAAREAASRVAASEVRSIVVDVETGDALLRLAEELADSMGARYLRVGDATAEHIDRVVRLVISPPAGSI